LPATITYSSVQIAVKFPDSISTKSVPLPAVSTTASDGPREGRGILAAGAELISRTGIALELGEHSTFNIQTSNIEGEGCWPDIDVAC